MPSAAVKDRHQAWGICPVCLKERRITPARKIVTAHRRYDRGLAAMIPCPGSGQSLREVAR